MKGKPWPVEDERKLRDWVVKGVGLDALAMAFEGRYSNEAVRQKIMNLGLVENQQAGLDFSSNLEACEGLISVKEALELQLKATKALDTPGLSKNEIIRLRSVVDAWIGYQIRTVNFMNVSRLEAELVASNKEKLDLIKNLDEMNKKFALLQKKTANDASR